MEGAEGLGPYRWKVLVRGQLITGVTDLTRRGAREVHIAERRMPGTLASAPESPYLAFERMTRSAFERDKRRYPRLDADEQLYPQLEAMITGAAREWRRKGLFRRSRFGPQAD